jgi:hypothetical protein
MPWQPKAGGSKSDRENTRAARRALKAAKRAAKKAMQPEAHLGHVTEIDPTTRPNNSAVWRVLGR